MRVTRTGLKKIISIMRSQIDFISRFKMNEIMKNLREEYSLNPTDLVRKRNQILAAERQIVHSNLI